MTNSDNFYLCFNKFEYNCQESWQGLQKEKSFSDVTLACENMQVKTHRMILSSYSPVLRNILKICPNGNPFIYFTGVNQRDLQYLLTFMYQGEVYVSGEDLTTFLKLAGDLNVRGLSERNKERIMSKEETPSQFINQNVITSPMTKANEGTKKIEDDNKTNFVDFSQKIEMEKWLALAKNEEMIMSQEKTNVGTEKNKNDNTTNSLDLFPKFLMTKHVAPKFEAPIKTEERMISNEEIPYQFIHHNITTSPVTKTNVETEKIKNGNNTNLLDLFPKFLMTKHIGTKFEAPTKTEKRMSKEETPYQLIDQNITTSPVTKENVEAENVKKYNEANSFDLLPKFAMTHTKFIAPTKTEIKLINQKKRMDDRQRMRQLQLNSLLGEDYTEVKCRICGKPFKTIANLRKHMQSIHEGKCYACDKCEYKSSRKDHLKQHTMTAHEGKRVSCGECNYTTPTSMSLKQHVLSIHKGKRYLCTQCNRQFISRGGLKSHVAKAMCNLEGNKMGNLRGKLNKGKRKCRLCIQCNKQFKTKIGHRNHVAKGKCNLERNKIDNHEEEKHKCDQCDYEGKTKSEVHWHSVETHIENPQACDKCDYKAASKQEIIAHALKDHNKCYACYKCDHRATTREALQLHLSKNHKLRNYACSKCQYKGTKKSNLRKHLKKHQNESNLS